MQQWNTRSRMLLSTKFIQTKAVSSVVVIILIPKEENPVQHMAKHVKTAGKVATLRKFVARSQTAVQKSTSNGILSTLSQTLTQWFILNTRTPRLVKVMMTNSFLPSLRITHKRLNRLLQYRLKVFQSEFWWILVPLSTC